ncbi:hypothetical protein [Microcoleus sp. BR0-C5]|uniref:hypothetical protein n=1 Tax=Microcoleus sp. BR0-C5 TaxID=2818713 RepID=UPI002FCF345F
MDDDQLRAIPYGIASLHGEAKKLSAKNGPGNGINEMHINQYSGQFLKPRPKPSFYR